MNWYSKILMKPGLILSCPVCQVKYPFGPVFDNYERTCPSCYSKIFEWHLDNKIVLLAPDNAPVELIKFIGYIKTLSEIEAFNTLTFLDQILCEQLDQGS